MRIKRLLTKHLFLNGILLIFAVLLSSSDILGQEYSGGTSMPVYKGGTNALKELLIKNLNYPDSIKNSGISGTVIVNLLINRYGKVENIKLMRGIHPICDAEAIRVASLLIDWQPARNCGKPVSCNVLLPIEFSGEKGANKASIAVSGTITEISTGRPLEGAFIFVKGTNVGTLTDANGRYKLNIDGENYDLEFSFVGFNTKTEHIGNSRTINVELEKGYYSLNIEN